jgi:hypothetical protein
MPRGQTCPLYPALLGTSETSAARCRGHGHQNSMIDRHELHRTQNVSLPGHLCTMHATASLRIPSGTASCAGHLNCGGIIGQMFWFSADWFVPGPPCLRNGQGTAWSGSGAHKKCTQRGRSRGAVQVEGPFFDESRAPCSGRTLTRRGISTNPLDHAI